MMQVATELPTDEVIFSASSSPIKNNTNNNKTIFSSCEEKAQAIRDCLQGNLGSENVDLWQLRQLALLPGGLLSPSLRKSAWAKLTGVSDVVWTTALKDEASFSSSPYNRLDSEDVKALQKDVAKMAWPIAELLQQQSSKEGANTEEYSFWYVPLQRALKLAADSSSPHNEEEPGLIPSPTSCVSDHTSHTEMEANEDSSSLDSTVNTSITSFQKHKTVFSSSTPSKSSNNNDLSLSSDQNTLQQVLTQVLEQSPDYHYPSGLANIAALMLINLESPAFTSLLLSQLVMYPLYPMVTSKNSKEIGEEMTDLLCRLVDHFHLPLNCDLECIAQRAMTWFVDNNIKSVQMASRLLDVFVVSHPLLPLYVGAASLKYNGRLGESMEVIEDVLTTGLSYMEKLPPSELVAMAQNELSISNPQTPAWAVAASAPTDWALLESIQEEEHIDLPCFPLSPASSPTRRTKQQQQQHQNYSFETTEDASNWERLSTISYDFNQPLFPEEAAASPKHSDELQATHFYDSYPLAMCAAGLAVASSKADVNTSRSTRTGVLRFAVLVATMITLVAAYLQGLPQLPQSPSMNFEFSVSHLVPTAPKAGWTIMKAHGDSSDATTDNANEIPAAEHMLHQYMFQGMKQIQDKQAVVSIQTRLKILQPIAQQVQRLVRVWKLVVSKVFRRRPRNHGMKH